MTGVREYFSSLQEEEMDLVIEMGNNAKCRATGHGTVTFQRESGKPLMVRDVLYVPGMKKNLISVSTLEDRGYVVSFQDGRVYIRPKDSKDNEGDWCQAERSCIGFSSSQPEHW
jgi:hypothetical protein